MSSPLFTLTINANSPDELDNAIRVLATAFGNMDRLTEVATVTGGTVQPLTGETSLDLEIERPAANAPEKAPEPQPEQVQVPAESTATDDDPAKLRVDAINKLTAWFGMNPGEMGKLQQLQAKYGVKLFKDIPDDKVRDFAQDAHLLVSGASDA